ncbi:MAG: alpha/beta hydrolase [Alphaproteobacteria bacterium]|nr:alpha/beta hydrolase [Alphaproteobacteria bacterium]
MAFVWLRENPVPQGGRLLTVATGEGARLRVALWGEGEEARGTVLLLNGRTEYIEKYFETVSELRLRRFAVATLDWRGQGKSGRALKNPLKGHIRDFGTYVGDLRHVMDEAVRPALKGPYVILAHSMGGAIGLTFLHDHPEAGIAAAIFSSPMFGLRTGDMPMQRARRLARLAARWGLADAFAQGSGRIHPIVEPFEKNVVTHDRDRFQRSKALIRAEPELALGGPTFGWVDAAFRATERFEDPAWLAAVKTPVLIVSAGNEELVDNAAQARVAEGLPDAELVTVEGAKHEILQESRALRARFWEIFDAFTADVVPAG